MRRSAVLLAFVLLCACDNSTDEPVPATGGGGTGGMAGAGGAAACSPGESMVDDACLSAGIPADMCASGLASDGRGGCVPILPAEACPSGLMAIPGETACRPVADCGDGTWGVIPVEAGTIYVDVSNVPGPGTGTALDPFASIRDAVDAASAGGMIAIAAGTYSELISLFKTVRIWGRCPEMVSLVGDGLSEAMFINAADVEVHTVGFAAPSFGVLVEGTGVLLDRVWIHDTADLGVPTLAPTVLTIRDSLIERASGLGVAIDGSELIMERSVIRETQGSANGPGRALSVVPGFTSGEASRLTLSDSVLRGNREAGVASIGAQITIDRTAIIDTLPQADARFGIGVVVQEMGNAVIRDSYIGRSHAFGVTVLNSTAVFERTTIEGVAAQVADGGFGDGVVVLASTFDAFVDITRSRISGAARAGVASFDARVVLDGVALECNAIHLNGEAVSGDYSFDDKGGNACWCGDVDAVCKVLSSNLEPPAL